jgi:rRNA-processing protein FCF1
MEAGVDMRKIIIDTSFWLMPFERKIDLFAQLDRLLEEPYEVIVPQAVLDELGLMARGRMRRAVAARGALRVIENKIGKEGHLPHITLSSEKGKADGAIITTALQHEGCYVATNDYILRKRLREKKVNSITLLDGNKLGFP